MAHALNNKYIFQIGSIIFAHCLYSFEDYGAVEVELRMEHVKLCL
jgi:hypothetical protein